ncbi:hypothetical protein [Caldimonas brevitalea]|uniref:Uncharacterized protein n=1 Tax=Caldimonas brevitalea TaxID=413882 RepID=A0A0G3BM52_9BURK|nr:hypothetical protein [Caldimonas brevitalea]AKJ29068.1 hypothetical protein AAW51_2377 [Caldimonas brevitalea]
MRSYLTASLSLVLAAHLSAAHACAPPGPGHIWPTLEESVDRAFEQADLVFVGKVILMTVKPSDPDHFLITLKVETTYKGLAGATEQFEIEVRPPLCPSLVRNENPTLGATGLYFAKVQAAGPVYRLMTLLKAYPEPRAHPLSPEQRREIDTALTRITKQDRPRR